MIIAESSVRVSFFNGADEPADRRLIEVITLELGAADARDRSRRRRSTR